MVMTEWDLAYHQYYTKLVNDGKEPLPYYYWIRKIMKGEQEQNR